MKNSGDLSLKCPSCGERQPIERYVLYDAADIPPEVFAHQWNRASVSKDLLVKARADVARSTLNRVRGINIGFIMERAALILPNFPFVMGDCRAIFDPIDYVVFEGLSEGEVRRIHILDIKTGGSQLTKKQAAISRLIGRGKVSFELY